ncbi:MAG: hypothetical protein QNJ97_27535 [Myxococcota bacterium]|nr:hypothetical protein [Myxococcota bacterium]
MGFTPRHIPTTKWFYPALLLLLALAIVDVSAAQEPIQAPAQTDQHTNIATNDPTFPKLTINARLMTGLEVEHRAPKGAQSGSEKTEYGFFLQQARVYLKARLTKDIRINVSAELSDALDAISASDQQTTAAVDREDRIPYLRNAYVNLRAHKALQARAGRFKLPFSRLENRSTGRLPFRGRGLSNDIIIEDAMWGDRAIGAMVWGEIEAIDVRYYASVSNPHWDVVEPNDQAGVTALGRIEIAPLSWLSMGLNGGHMYAKYDKNLGLPKVHFNAFGGDIRLRFDDLYMAFEAIAGQRRIIDQSATDPQTNAVMTRSRDPYAFGATGYVSYDISLPCAYVLQPVVFGEFADADWDYKKTEALRAILGINLKFGRGIRLMPQVELIQPLEVSDGAWHDPIDRPLNQWKSRQTYYLLLSAEL